MSEPTAPSGPSTQPPAAADSPAIHAADELGAHVGRFAALTLRQLGAMAAGLARTGAATVPLDSPGSATSREPEAATAPPAPATVRAEKMVSRAGADVGALAAAAGDRVRKAAALAREEAEDLWAEAQELRRCTQRDASDAP